MTPRELARGLGLMRYAPDEPRVPAGVSGGGEWTFGDGTPAAGKPANTVVAADTTTPDGHIMNDKTQRRMKSRNVTPQQIDDAVRNGANIDALNKKTGGPAIRYVNPATGASVVIDTPTNRVIHVGEPHFEYGEKGGDVPGAVMRPGPSAPAVPTIAPPVPVIESPVLEEPTIMPDIILPP